MKINWIVRIKNKTFWISFIPALLLLVQTVASIFSYTLDLGDLGDKLLNAVNVVFVILTLLGIVTDPTTKGTSDSERALEYKEPN